MRRGARSPLLELPISRRPLGVWRLRGFGGVSSFAASGAGVHMEVSSLFGVEEFWDSQTKSCFCSLPLPCAGGWAVAVLPAQQPELCS